MTQLFRSKSCGLVGLTEFNSPPPTPIFNGKEDYGDEEEDDNDGDSNCESYDTCDRISTPFISLASKAAFAAAAGANKQADGESQSSSQIGHNQHMFPVVDFLMAALRKSLVTCSVDREDVSSMDISWPSDVRHVSHVTFDRFDGFLGLPTELEPEVPRKAPSASASVFGVSAQSMQCSYDDRGNSVPTILLMMQKRLYSGGGLKAEGIFRINADNSQEEFVRDQLNRGVVPHGIDVHCLSGLIKAWFRELPAGVLDSLTPEKVVHCNTEDDCTKLVKLLPPTEAALLVWAINLMADVVQHEEFNKMNARNIAMVFAPNMTKMADPLTALIHAVQVMNFLKTLILKIIRERSQEFLSKTSPLSSCSDSTLEAHTINDPVQSNMSSTATLDEVEWKIDEKLWCTEVEGNGERDYSESVSCGSTPSSYDVAGGALENERRGRYHSKRRLSLRKGVLKLSRHPMFQLTKQTKTKNLGFVITRGGGGEDWGQNATVPSC